MEQKEIKDLIDYLVERDIAEFELERGDLKLRVKRGVTAAMTAAHAPATAPENSVPVATAASRPEPSAPMAASGGGQAEEEAGLHIVRSPIVGSYYESPSPGAPPFIKVGDEVRSGQVLCIVEAMKLMNEIESDVSGEIVKMMAANGQPVEYGQPLFAIRVK